MVAAARAVREMLHRVGIEVARYPASTPYAVHLRELLDVLRVECVVDVGAHEGEFGSLLRAVGYRGRIVSFEPQTRPYQRLAARASNDVEWETRQLALGEAAGKMSLTIARKDVFSSLLRPRVEAETEWGSEIGTVGEEWVSVETIAGLGGFAAPTFLKTDTQGFDLHVLRGARDRLRSFAGVQAEVSFVESYIGASTFREILEFMEAAGFRLTGVYPVAVNKRTLALLEADCLWRNE